MNQLKLKLYYHLNPHGKKNIYKKYTNISRSILFAYTDIYRFLNKKESVETPLPATIEKIHTGKNKNVLVLMSAGTTLGNTDRAGFSTSTCC